MQGDLSSCPVARQRLEGPENPVDRHIRALVVGCMWCELNTKKDVQLEGLSRCCLLDMLDVLLNKGRIHATKWPPERAQPLVTQVEIDRRMVDFIVGLDSEVHQLVEPRQPALPFVANCLVAHANWMQNR